MSESPTHLTRSFSPWWALLLLPFGLLLGWLVGQSPSPKLQQPKVAAPQVGAPVPASEQTPRGEFSQWTTLDQAMAESYRNGKPVLIDFSADWCGPCQALKREVFEDAGRGRVVQTTVIPVSIVDRRREEGRNPPEIESLQQRFQVDAFPTLVMLSPQSKRAVRTQGFGGADQTVAWITEAAKSVR